MTSKQIDFWITNFSNRNVSLSDLNLTIKAFSSVNLLDKKHYQYTLTQLEKSATNGSIFNKKDKLVIRKLAPETMKKTISINRETFIPTRERSIFSMKDENYEELAVSDEELAVSDEDFAKENADTAEMDSQKQIIFKG